MGILCVQLQLFLCLTVETMKGLNKAIGSLATLALLFKTGKREDLLAYGKTKR